MADLPKEAPINPVILEPGTPVYQKKNGEWVKIAELSQTLVVDGSLIYKREETDG